ASSCPTANISSNTCRRRSSRPARWWRIPTTAPCSRATSCSAYPARRTTITSSITSSSRWAWITRRSRSHCRAVSPRTWPRAISRPPTRSPVPSSTSRWPPRARCPRRRRKWRMAPGVNGYDLGFYDENRNGLRIIGHAGDTDYFHSDLHLLTDKDVGFFISANSLGTDGAAEQVRTGIFRAFLDRYYPYTPPVEPTVAHPQVDGARVAGWYLTSRRIESALGIINVLTQLSVTALPNGEIEVAPLKNLAGVLKRWREVGPLTYREVGGQTHLKFVTDPAGHVDYWIADDFLPVMVFQQVHGFSKKGDVTWMGSIFLAVLILTVAIWFGGWIVRRRIKRPLLMTPREKHLRVASRVGVLV